MGWPRADVGGAFEDIAAVLPPEADGEPEGWLFPNTYEVRPDQTPAA